MSVIKNNPVESIATAVGFIILAFGLIIGEESGWVGISGSVLAVLGSFLSAVAGTWVFGQSSANKGLVSQLNILRGQLATASAQISYTVDMGISGDEEPRICLTKIEQTTSTLMMVVHDLSRLTDKTFDLEKDAILSAKKTLSDLGNNLHEIENTDVNRPDIRDEMFLEFNKQIKRALTSLDRAVPTPKGGHYTQKKRPVEIPKPEPKDILLARIRKLGMQLVSPDVQEFIIGKIHDYLLKHKSYIITNELRCRIMDEGVSDSLANGAITKSKFNQIFNIFLRAGAFDKQDVMSADGNSLKSIKIKREFEDFRKFRELHDAVFHAVSKGINIPPQRINELLYGNIGGDYVVSSDMIAYVNNNLRLEEGFFVMKIESGGGVRDYTGDPRVKYIMSRLREIASSDAEVFEKISQILTAFEENSELRKELKGNGVPLSTVREALTVVMPGFQQYKHGFIKFSDLIKHVSQETNIVVKEVPDKGVWVFLNEQ